MIGHSPEIIICDLRGGESRAGSACLPDHHVERHRLKKLVRTHTAAQRDVTRASVVLLAARRLSNNQIKVRARGHSAGGVLLGLAAAQLAGQDHLVGLDRLCRCGGSGVGAGGGVGFDHRGGTGPADQPRAVGGGGDQGTRGDRPDAGPVNARVAGGAVAVSDDRRDEGYFRARRAEALALSGEPDEAATVGLESAQVAKAINSERSIRVLKKVVRTLTRGAAVLLCGRCAKG